MRDLVVLTADTLAGPLAQSAMNSDFVRHPDPLEGNRQA